MSERINVIERGTKDHPYESPIGTLGMSSFADNLVLLHDYLSVKSDGVYYKWSGSTFLLKISLEEQREVTITLVSEENQFTDTLSKNMTAAVKKVLTENTPFGEDVPVNEKSEIIESSSLKKKISKMFDGLF